MFRYLFRHQYKRDSYIVSLTREKKEVKVKMEKAESALQVQSLTAHSTPIRANRKKGPGADYQIPLSKGRKKDGAYTEACLRESLQIDYESTRLARRSTQGMFRYLFRHQYKRDSLYIVSLTREVKEVKVKME